MTDVAIARLEERIEALRERVSATDSLIVRELEGFPQTYAKGTELHLLADTVGQLRTDYVQRRDFEALRERIVTNEARIFRLYGGLMVVAAIGVANLYKLFAG